MFQWSRYKKVFQSYWDFKRIYVFRRLSPFLDYFSLSWPLFRGGRTAARVFPNHFLINVHPPSHLLPPPPNNLRPLFLFGLPSSRLPPIHPSSWPSRRCSSTVNWFIGRYSHAVFHRTHATIVAQLETSNGRELERTKRGVMAITQRIRLCVHVNWFIH